jgi:capsular exopolysaccharide synthesis family protein
MSRFYDALTQAISADLIPTNGNASSGASKANIHHPPAADGRGENGTVAAVIAAAEQLAEDHLSEQDPPAISSEEASSTSIGELRNIAVDRDARVLPNAADGAVLEYYRRLRTNILQQQGIKPFRSLLVTSANPQEGKTVTTLNLALSFAMLPEFKVLVIDCDLRRGTIGKWLRATERPGFSNLIDGSSTLRDVVFRCDDVPVHFIAKGTSEKQPAELLQTSQLSAHIRRLTGQFDLVLVDSPPVNFLTDTQVLAGACDAVLLVARAFSTSKKALEKAAHDLSRFRMIGTVLNGGTRPRNYRKYGGYYEEKR